MKNKKCESWECDLAECVWLCVHFIMAYTVKVAFIIKSICFLSTYLEKKSCVVKLCFAKSEEMKIMSDGSWWNAQVGLDILYCSVNRQHEHAKNGTIQSPKQQQQDYRRNNFDQSYTGTVKLLEWRGLETRSGHTVLLLGLLYYCWIYSEDPEPLPVTWNNATTVPGLQRKFAGTVLELVLYLYRVPHNARLLCYTEWKCLNHSLRQ